MNRGHGISIQSQLLSYLTHSNTLHQCAISALASIITSWKLGYNNFMEIRLTYIYNFIFLLNTKILSINGVIKEQRSITRLTHVTSAQ